MNIKITSDSTCDLPLALRQQHNIDLFPLTIVKNGENFQDNVTITPDDIFAHVAAGGDLCTTAAGNAAEYEEMFAKYAGEYDGVVHINIGAGFSCSYQNASIAAAEFDNVVTIDSQNLSTGQALVVMKAVQLAKECQSLAEIKEKLDELNAIEAELGLALSGKEWEVCQKYVQTNIEYVTANITDSFINGFKFGARFALSAFVTNSKAAHSDK